MMTTDGPVKGRRMRRIAVGACAALAVVGAVPAAADPPTASVGNTFHGFLADDGAVTPIDHPDAATVPPLRPGSPGP